MARGSGVKDGDLRCVGERSAMVYKESVLRRKIGERMECAYCIDNGVRAVRSGKKKSND